MENRPLFSIVTPSYNQAGFIKETIESVLGQNHSSLEYIVIDGGSSDGSKDIIKKYENRLAYWCSEKDDGQSHAIMKGFEHSKGELLAWVNSDDVLFPGCLEMVARYYEKENQPDIITANIAYIDFDSVITQFIRVPKQSRYLFFRGIWHGTQPCVFYRADLFRRICGINKKYSLSMDLDLWMRLMKAGARTAHIPNYLGGFRWHSSSKTSISQMSRNTRENPETTEILNDGLINSNQSKRMFWKYFNNVHKTLNLNYLMAYLDYKKLPLSCNWHEYVKSQYFKQQMDTLR